MSDKYRSSCVAEAFDRALDILGNESKQALIWHLKQEYGVDVAEIGPPDISKIRYALTSLLGTDGSEIVLEYLDTELKRRH